MNPLDQRIAIAESVGHKWSNADTVESGYTSWHHFVEQCGVEVLNYSFPDYLTDLNAMHEVEKTIAQKMAYVIALHRICNVDNSAWDLPTTDKQWNYVTATAAQRAEAYLRTIGKWKD